MFVYYFLMACENWFVHCLLNRILSLICCQRLVFLMRWLKVRRVWIRGDIEFGFWYRVSVVFLIMPMVVILIPILIALLYCLLMQVPNKYNTFEIISFGQFCIRISLCLGSSKRLNIYIKIIRTYKEAILFINKGEILTISYDVLLIMFYMCLPYFQGKERYLGFVESFANLGCSLALHFFWGGGGGVGNWHVLFVV